jgi:DNA-binding MarR family transcriptional regulator/predicted GNAT family N-acyltransferase
MSSDASITQVRRFNRTVTQRIGALSNDYLSRNRSLGASRVLWEIGTEGCEVRSLRARLGLDSGQTSRVLRGLERDGLLELAPSPVDGRIRFARLTASGIAERALLDERSDELAGSILAPLDERRRAQLVTAMRTVERLITTSMVSLQLVDPAGADARRCLRAYFAELDRRSELPFDPAKGSSAEPHELRARAGAFLVAYLREEPIGCGGVKHRAGEPSEIKRMWVAESARGLGIGRRLLVELERIAAEAGAPAVRLDTNKELVEAIAMYRSAGYREIPRFNDEPFAHHWFERALRRVPAGTASV